MEKAIIPKYVFQENKFIVKGNDGKRQILEIVDDMYPESPREWGNVGTMVCFHRRYSLGDAHDFREPDDFLQNMVRDHVPVNKLIKAVREAKTNLTLSFNRRSREWELSGPCYWRTVIGSSEPEIEVFDTRPSLDCLYDSIIEELSMSAMQQLLEDIGEVAMLPLYLYDHSGITMSTGPFSCPWDSGQVGWIYLSKEKTFEENLGWISTELRATGDPAILNNPKNWEHPNNKNWKKIAYHHLQSEVETYDDFLTGNVFGYKLYEIDEDGNAGCEIDSCYGYYGDEYGRNGILSEFAVLESA